MDCSSKDTLRRKVRMTHKSITLEDLQGHSKLLERFLRINCYGTKTDFVACKACKGVIKYTPANGTSGLKRHRCTNPGATSASLEKINNIPRDLSATSGMDIFNTLEDVGFNLVAQHLITLDTEEVNKQDQAKRRKIRVAAPADLSPAESISPRGEPGCSRVCARGKPLKCDMLTVPTPAALSSAPEEDVKTLYVDYLKTEILNREQEMRYRELKMLKVEKEIQLLDKQLTQVTNGKRPLHRMFVSSSSLPTWLGQVTEETGERKGGSGGPVTKVWI